MDRADDIGAGEVQQIVVALQIGRVGGQQIAAEIGLVQAQAGLGELPAHHGELLAGFALGQRFALVDLTDAAVGLKGQAPEHALQVSGKPAKPFRG